MVTQDTNLVRDLITASFLPPVSSFSKLLAGSTLSRELRQPEVRESRILRACEPRVKPINPAIKSQAPASPSRAPVYEGTEGLKILRRPNFVTSRKNHCVNVDPTKN
ncbi:hypothetical protein PUN28_001506 [Cardiocondyla obscurior]|uniref:Uncharacterized protein n=1 Tax=Cardiocondyla obscurior TaxID=286306 RepID=A0AAW2H5E5_9HYME